MSFSDDKIRAEAFWLLFLASMITAAGNTALISVLPAMTRELHLPDAYAAAVFSLSGGIWTLTAPIWAKVSDTRGRKPIVLLGVGGFLTSMFLLGLVALAALKGLVSGLFAFGLLLATRAIYGGFGSAANPAAQAYVADRTDADERTEALAFLGSALGLGTVLGPALAPFFIIPGLGLAGPMLVFTAIGLGVFFLVKLKLPAGDYQPTDEGHRPTSALETEDTAQTKGGIWGQLWQTPGVRPFMIYAFVMGSAQAINSQTLGFQVIDALNLPPVKAQTFIGLALFAGAAATLIAQWGLIRLLHLNPKDLLRWGAVLIIGGNLIGGLMPGFHAAVVGYTLASFGYAFARPGFTSGASLTVGPDLQAKVAGVLVGLNGACWLASPIIGVALYQALKPTPFMLVATIMAGLFAYCLFNPALKHAGRATN